MLFQWARARVYLHEAMVRMMAGAAPGKTQQLLDKSLIQRNSARGLICIKGERHALSFKKIDIP